MTIDSYLHILQTCSKTKHKIYKDYNFVDFKSFGILEGQDQILINILLRHLIIKYQDEDQSFIKSKHQKYLETETSIFKGVYKSYQQTLIKAQKTYLAFTRFVQIWKQTRPHYNDTDLTLNPITTQSHIKIYQNKKLYVFTLFDLINIIEKSLCNCDNYFVDPLVIKNPYNNMEFTHAQLYNMYFKIKLSSYVMPGLFHGYFKSNFDMHIFSTEYESQIRNNYIHNKIYKTNNKVLFQDIKTMIFFITHGNYKMDKKIVDMKDLPEFIKIMRPYYYLYMYGYEYVHGLEKTNKCHKMLKHKISELFYLNPYFGRIKMKREPITRKFRKYIDLEHPEFTINEIKNCHIYNSILNYNIFNTVDEDEDEDEDNEYDDEMNIEYEL